MTKKVAKKVAKKETKKREKKQPDYVAASYKITYSMPFGLVGMLAVASGKEKKEVWCILSEMCNICALRLSKKANQQSSWTEEYFPNTKIYLQIEMMRDRNRWDYSSNQWVAADPSKITCTIDLGFADKETFTQQQINDYVTEKIILGDDEDEVPDLQGSYGKEESST